MIYNVKPNICICIFVSNGRLSFVLEVRRRVLGFSKYHNTVDIYSKYVWVVLLKDKKDITITNAFQKN